MKGKRKSAKVAEPPRDKPALWKRLLAAVLSPLLFLALAEIVLRVAGYGYPTGFFIPWKVAGQKVYLANEHYCEHFVPKELSRTPEQCMLGRKDDKTIRVFVLGGSAAYGDPDPAYGFCRQLDLLLSEHTGGKSFEVVNAAVTAMNSHVVRRIARDCASQRPDLFIVFMGNNEVVGPYGPPTLPGPLYASRGFINACITAKKATRVGQAVSNIGHALRTKGRPQQKWMGMEGFLTNRIAADDPKLRDCYRHFRDNLSDIVRTARDCGAGVIACTVPTNIESCAPFASQHEPGLTPEAVAAFDEAFQQARTAEQAGDIAGALAGYEKARQIDGSYADAAFCMGRCLVALGRIDEARRAFIEARDLDVLRFRADTPILRTIRETAQAQAAQGVRLLDLEAALEARTTEHLLGENLLVDHVHLNFRGNFLAAYAAMQTIREMVPQGGLVEPKQSEEELFKLSQQRLLYDDHERYRLAMVMYLRKTLPPFAGQIDHDAEIDRLDEELIGLRRVERVEKDSEAPYLDALERRPLDTYLVLRHGQFLTGAGRMSEAVDVYRKALDARPFDMRLRVPPAQMLVQGGSLNEAVAVLMSRQSPDRYSREEALLVLGAFCASTGNIPQATAIYEQLGRIDPENVDVLINQAAAASYGNDLTLMKSYLDKALAEAPDSVQALTNMGNYYAKQNQPREAQKWFARAVEVEPQNPFGHIGLGIQSARLNEMDKAIKHLTQAVRLKPDFVEAHLLLAAIYDKAGKKEEAQRHMELSALFRNTPQRQ
jgi:tetratricopeptide (TPR) repeat protein